MAARIDNGCDVQIKDSRKSVDGRLAGRNEEETRNKV
jgi:hypothetical protein